jgi:hypothetical protein
VQPGVWRLAHQRAGDIEIVAIFVGAGADNGIVISNRIGFADRDVIAEFGATRQLIGRAGPGGLAAEPRIELHQLAGAAHGFGIVGFGAEIGIGQAHHAIVGPGGNRQLRAVVHQIAGEIDMGPACVEAGVDMGENDRTAGPTISVLET